MEADTNNNNNTTTKQCRLIILTNCRNWVRQANVQKDLRPVEKYKNNNKKGSLDMPETKKKTKRI